MNPLSKIIPKVFPNLTYRFGEEEIIYEINYVNMMSVVSHDKDSISAEVTFNRKTPKNKVSVANRVLIENLRREVNQKVHYMGLHQIFFSLSKEVDHTECL